MLVDSPPQPLSNKLDRVARLVSEAVSGTVAYVIGRSLANRSRVFVDEQPKPLAERIRARLEAETELVQMSDAQIEQIASILSPVPAVERSATSSSLA